jgi:hypothetical protein
MTITPGLTDVVLVCMASITSGSTRALRLTAQAEAAPPALR